MENKRKVVFISKRKGESDEEYEMRIEEIIAEEAKNGYVLVNREEKGGGVFLTFEGTVE